MTADAVSSEHSVEKHIFRMLLIVFVFSMFLSSALLLLVEPMIAKMLLPMLGGTASLWNTCLVFFQAALLVGYMYAHASSRWLSRRTQIIVHFALVLLPFVCVGLLPLHLPANWEPPTEISPVLWVLATLSVSVGLPFLILSATAPILQGWFAESGRVALDAYCTGGGRHVYSQDLIHRFLRVLQLLDGAIDSAPQVVGNEGAIPDQNNPDRQRRLEL